MKESIFSTLREYFNKVAHGFFSLLNAGMTVLPYLIRLFSKTRDLCKEVTEQYPDPISSRMADDLPPRTKGLLFNDIHRCTGCLECQRVCPSHCIEIENEPGPDAQKPWVAIFDIDYSKCIFCGLCVNVCQPGSLVHTKKYEASAFNKTDLIAHFGLGRVPAEKRLRWDSERKVKDVEDLTV